MLIALESYDDGVMSQIIENEAVDGAVLGDLFCNYRMFAGGDAELPERMQRLKEAGKKVYYQTPCYLVDAVFEQTLQKILYWNGRGLLDGVLLQDVGLLSRLGKPAGNSLRTSGDSAAFWRGEGASGTEAQGLTLVWSFMGAARNGAVNLMHYRFLESLAPVVISEDRPGRFAAMRENGIPVMPTYGRMAYATVNRLCYYRYQNGLDGADCNRACLDGALHMVNDTFHMDMTVDGHMLGKKYEYEDFDETPGLVYARDYEECARRIRRWKKGGNQ